jgi:hypothetical protein
MKQNINRANAHPQAKAAPRGRADSRANVPARMEQNAWPIYRDEAMARFSRGDDGRVMVSLGTIVFAAGSLRVVGG